MTIPNVTLTALQGLNIAANHQDLVSADIQAAALQNRELHIQDIQEVIPMLRVQAQELQKS